MTALRNHHQNIIISISTYQDITTITDRTPNGVFFSFSFSLSSKTKMDNLLAHLANHRLEW